MVASFAWACTPATTVHTSVNSGLAGTLVNITGKTAAADKPVEIRWDRNDGSLLGTVQGASFATVIKIPADADPGVYYLVADGRARDTFEVTGPGAVPTKALSGDLWNGFSTSAPPAIRSSEQIQGASPARSSTLPLGLALATVGIGGLLVSSSFMVMKRKALSKSAKR